MKIRNVVLHPFALAIYPILHIANRNADWGVEASDLLVPIALAFTITTLAWFLIRRKGGSATTTGAFTLLIVVFLFWYGLSLNAFEATLRLPRLGTHAIAITTWGGLLISGWIFIDRRRPDTPALNNYLNLFAVILLLFPLVGLVRTDSEPPLAPPPAGMDDSGLTSDGSTLRAEPDLFYLVLDGYSASRFLGRNFGFDNSSFVEALRERGFAVPTRARANYIHTHLSLASMLNWTHLLFLEEHGEGSDRSLTYGMIENNRAARYLKSRGYEFVFLPTTFPATSGNRLADRQIPPPRGNDPDLLIIWLRQTPLTSVALLGCRVFECDTYRWFPYPPESGEEIREKFRILEDLARESGPKFVFAHLLVPHPPYVLGPDCTSREPTWPPSGDPEAWPLAKEGYTDQIRCLNTLVLDLVDEIIEESAGSAIIVLQSDHGSGRMQLDPLVNETIPFDELEPEQIAERSGVFAAYYLPDARPQTVPDSITPVNVFPLIFNGYFGESIPYREDATFWSDYRRSYRFQRIQELPKSDGALLR